MKVCSELNYKNLALAVSALSTLAFVGGCCTKSTGGTAYYSRHQPAYVGGTAQEERPQASSTGESASSDGCKLMLFPI
jgi:hypothetical protein